MSYYVLEHGCAVHLPRSQNAVLLGELLSGYTQGNTFDMIPDSTENVITIGFPAPIPSLDLGVDCAVVEISEKGIAVVGADAANGGFEQKYS